MSSGRDGRRKPATAAGGGRRRARIRCSRTLVLVGLATCLAAFLALGGHVLAHLAGLRSYARAHLCARLCVRHDLAMLASMDGPHPCNEATLQPIDLRECSSTPGKVGDARRIDLDRDAIIRIYMPTPPTGPSATYAAWFRPVDCTKKQSLFNCGGESTGFALFLKGGNLHLAVFWDGAEVSGSCPYAGIAGSMTHVAAVFSHDDAAIYQNGRESLRITLGQPVSFTHKPLTYGRTEFWPFEGDIDELAVWRRSLNVEEIVSVAHARRGIAWMYEPGLAFCVIASARLESFMSSFLRAIDRLAPATGKAANMSTSIPILTFWPSKGDERHWAHAHAESVRDGFRTRKAATFRSVDMAMGDKVIAVEIALDDIYSSDTPPRMAFLVRDDSGTLFGGSGMARIYPPELHEVFHPDARYPLPLAADFVRLYFGSGFHGIYVVEPFDRVGSVWFAYGDRRKAVRKAAIYDSPCDPCDTPPPGTDAAAVFRGISSLVASDVFFPWSRVEAKSRARMRSKVWLSRNIGEKRDERLATAPSAGSDLPTLSLHFGLPVGKCRRTDFSCLYTPPGGGTSQWLAGTGSTGGGVRHRGNTSYANGARRSLSLKFDKPVALMDDGLPSRHLVLLSGYADPTRLRNRISFDAYRAAAAGRTPNGITRIGWAKVFVNGEYFGVWEIAHRVRDIRPSGNDAMYRILASKPRLWQSPLPYMSEAVAPTDVRADSARPLLDLFALTVGDGWRGFADIAHEVLDIDSFIDLLLMLHFTQNQDGQVTNQYLAHDSATGKWFVIPWDYDKTFLNSSPYSEGNDLLYHLQHDVDGFSAKATAKWRSLRAGALSDEAMMESIDAYASQLTPLMDEEYRLWPPEGWDGDYRSAVQRLKEIVLARLKTVDNHFK